MSRTGIIVVALVAALSVGWVVLVPDVFAWPGLAWVALAAVAFWVAKRSIRSTRSMTDVIGDVEGEPALAAARPKRRAPAPAWNRVE